MGRKKKVLSVQNIQDILNETEDAVKDEKIDISASRKQRAPRAAKLEAVENFQKELQSGKKKKKKKKKKHSEEEVADDSDVEVPRSAKKRARLVDSSDEDEVRLDVKTESEDQAGTGSEKENPVKENSVKRKKKRRRLLGSDDDTSNSINPDDKENTPCEDDSSDNKKSSQSRRILRVVDSSDDEAPAPTPKQKKKKQLEKMVENINKKKGKRFEFLDDEVSSQHSSDIDEDELPMFEHEEFPPESDDDKKIAQKEDEDEGTNEDDDFIDDEEISEDGDCEEEESEEGGSDEDDERKEDQGEEDESDSGSSQYMNPYLEPGASSKKRMNVKQELANISRSLSRTTKEDKENKKKYKAEMGKYQFQVRSERNKAAKVDEKTRYKRNLKVARFDAGLKEMRNLEKEDEDFFDTQEANVCGTQVQIFPHTKKRSAYNSECEVSGCGREFIKNVSKVVGAKFLDHFNAKFMKKKNRFDKDSYYYICRHHMLSDEKSSESESDSD